MDAKIDRTIYCGSSTGVLRGKFQNLGGTSSRSQTATAKDNKTFVSVDMLNRINQKHSF